VNEDVMRVTVRLKGDSEAMYGNSKGNDLIIQKAPEEKVFIKINAKAPGTEPKEIRTDLSLVYKDRYENAKIPGAYEVVLKNVIQGDHSNCGWKRLHGVPHQISPTDRVHHFLTAVVREDELIAAWEIFTPILQYIEGNDGPKPVSYKYGSDGPEGWQNFEKDNGYDAEDDR
jgi:glucose-6-phosphate 1-dehydrogenase